MEDLFSELAVLLGELTVAFVVGLQVADERSVEGPLPEVNRVDAGSLSFDPRALSLDEGPEYARQSGPLRVEIGAKSHHARCRRVPDT